MKAEEFATREISLAGWPVRITSYRLGERYYATVESLDVGARIARADAASRMDAENAAVNRATERLARTRRR